MAQTVAITKDIQWIGVFDSELRVFDIIMETKYGTTYNSYVVKTSAGFILVETVKERFFDSYWEHVKSTVGDVSKIKYLITNHTEPDHAGSMARVLKLIPDCIVIGSKTAVSYLKDIMNIEFHYRTAESLNELKFGDKTFQFLSVPMLHWPDSMWTYCPEEQALFTCDSFGAHYSPKKSIKLSELPASEEADYQDGFLYYYNAIFSPFKPYVLKGIEKIDGYKLKVICDGHGPVLDCRIDEIIGKYKSLSTVIVNHPRKTVVIPYVSAYGYTEEIAIALEKGIKEIDSSIEVTRKNINLYNYEELKPGLLQAVADADGILFGTCTINGDALPPIWDLALSMNPITHGGKVVSAFGSYGWSGEGVDNIMDRLRQLRLEVVDPFKIKFRASEQETKDAVEYGKIFARAVLDGKAPPSKLSHKTVTALNWEELNPTGKVCLWRCVVCGETFRGVSPPLVCPACGVGQECFELVEEEAIDFLSDKPENFVIIGSGIAGLSAAEAIRARNPNAVITVLSYEQVLPYRRPALSDLIVKDLPYEEFYIHTEEWYKEKKLDMVLNCHVDAVDPKTKTVKYTLGGKQLEIKYHKLIMAMGSYAFMPPLPGSDLEGVFSIKWKEAAEGIRAYAKGKKRVVVIGGGVLGLEAVDALQQLGLEVEVLEFMPRIMPRQLDETASAVFQKILANKGVIVKCGVSASEVVGKDGKVIGVKIQGSDEMIPCDMVIVNIGVRAVTRLAKDCGLKINRGIVVNERCQTSDPDIYAAGDVAEYGNLGIQLWEVAIDMGKVAGANAVGDHLTFSWKVFPVSLIAFGTDLFSMGGIPAADLDEYQVVDVINMKQGYYRKFFFKNDKLVCGIMIGDTLKRCNVVLNGVRQGHSYDEVMAGLHA